MYPINIISEDKIVTITINKIAIVLDVDKLNLFMNPPKSILKNKIWHFDDDRLLYTKTNNCGFLYLYEVITAESRYKMEFTFKNNNIYDYRLENIEFEDKLRFNCELYLTAIYDKIIEFRDGHIIRGGQYANEYRNPYWLVRNCDELEYYVMHLTYDKFFKFSISSLDKILNVPEINGIPTWFYSAGVGYVATSRGKTGNFYLHAHLLDHYGHGKGQDSIDHINRDKLDNRITNLRIVNQSEQNRNMGKRKRKKNAKPLPGELVQDDLPKYVNYAKENILDKNKKIIGSRDFFRIEKHPKLNGKRVATSKSKKKSIHQKLEQAKKILDDIEKGLY